MKILIFGGMGFVGKYLIEELTRHNHIVYVADILKNSSYERYYYVNIVDYNNVYELVNKIKPNCIVNLAGISSVAQSWNMPRETININLMGSINIMESIRCIDTKCKLLLIGSSEEYAPTDEKMSEESPIINNSPYSISKVSQEYFSELYRKKYGLNIVLTRTFNHTGIGQNINFVIPSFINQVKSKKENEIIEVGDLNIIRDIGDVRDMVMSYRMLIENNNNYHIYNIGSGKCYSLKDLLDHIIKISGKNLRITINTNRLRPSDNKKTWCDNTRFTSEYNCHPQHDILLTISEMYNHING